MQEMTLAQRMVEGRLPVAEALRQAMNLAEALRRLHHNGEVHGALTPDSVELTDAGLELVPAAPGSAAITPYTAPEVAQGQAPDARSDIFSFGAVLFEMLTGRRAFGEDSSRPAPSSSPAVDRVVGPCLARNPDARVPRMQIVIMELKLLTVTVRRAEAAAALQREKAESGIIRNEIQELEARVEVRLAEQARAHENAVADLQRSVNEVAAVLQQQISALHSDLTGTQESVATLAALKPEEQIQAVREGILSHVNGQLQALGDSVASIERNVGTLHERSQAFEQHVGADLSSLGQSIQAQSAAIDSARAGMSRTDDLVERVVEALESLQNAVLDAGKLDAEKSTMPVN